MQKKLIYYKDPAVKSGNPKQLIKLCSVFRFNVRSNFFITTELCCLSFSAFEKARQAHGTDEDIILIYR